MRSDTYGTIKSPLRNTMVLFGWVLLLDAFCCFPTRPFNGAAANSPLKLPTLLSATLSLCFCRKCMSQSGKWWKINLTHRLPSEVTASHCRSSSLHSKRFLHVFSSYTRKFLANDSLVGMR